MRPGVYFFYTFNLRHGPPGNVEYPNYLKIKDLSDGRWGILKKYPLIPARDPRPHLSFTPYFFVVDFRFILERSTLYYGSSGK